MLQLPTDKNDQIEIFTALFELSNSYQFKVTRKWLEDNYRRISKENTVAEGKAMMWNQGALQFIDDIMDFVDKSSEMVDTLRNDTT